MNTKPKVEEIYRLPDIDKDNLFYTWLMGKLGLPSLKTFGPDNLLDGMKVSGHPGLYHNVMWKVSHPDVGEVDVCVTFNQSGSNTSNVRFRGGIEYERAVEFVKDLPREVWGGVKLGWMGLNGKSIVSHNKTVGEALEATSER